MITHIFSVLLFILFLIISGQTSYADTQFEFHYINRPNWENTTYLVENIYDDNNLYEWIEDSGKNIIAVLPPGVSEESVFTEPGEWGEGVVTVVINSSLEVGTPLRMCLYGSEEKFFYQDERCEYSSVSKFRTAMAQIDLSPN